MKNNAPNIAFLGLSEKVSKSMNVGNQFTSLNVLNLRNEVVSFIYPMVLSHFNCLFAFYNIQDFKNVEIVGRTQKQKLIFSFNLTMKTENIDNEEKDIDNLQLVNSTISENYNWVIQAIPFPPNCNLFEPETLEIFAKENDEEVQIGQVHFLFAETPPLDAERVRAIKSNPTASKYIKVMLSCNTCNEELIVISGIKKPKLKKMKYGMKI